ncbi:MAG: DUF2490 domain-containing protein [Saprospiraceae bacterium]|nr:DUF2490 domain-containing protein [Saprospiraceae bacterium]
MIFETVKVLLAFIFFTAITLLSRAYSQDIRFTGIFQSYSQHNYFKKFDWVFNFSNILNPKDLQFDQLEYRASNIRLQIVNILHYRFLNNWRSAIGFHYQRNFPFDSRFSTEYRPFQQLEYDHNWRKIKVTHMLRFNQRFAENKSLQTFPLSLTLQYKTQIKFIAKHFSKENSNIYFTGYSEEYVTLSGPLRFQTYSEYWAYLGMGIQFNKKYKLDIGLGHEWLIRNDKKDVRSIYYPAVNFISSFNWKK